MGCVSGLTGVQQPETKEREHKVRGELQGAPWEGLLGSWRLGEGGSGSSGGGGFIQINMRLLFSFLIRGF